MKCRICGVEINTGGCGCKPINYLINSRPCSEKEYLSLTTKQFNAQVVQINEKREEIKRLKVKLDKAKECIKFYGNSNHWSKPYIRQGLIGYQVKIPLHEDGGKVARQTLEELEELGE